MTHVLNRRGVPLQALLPSSSGVALAAVQGAISPGRGYGGASGDTRAAA
jgi:hypothetical protein